MKKRLLTLYVSLVISPSLIASETPGSLVIAGGALSSSSIEILEKFTQLAGGREAKIGIVPAATSSIQKNHKLLSDIFESYGLKKDNIYLLPLAVKNDNKTKDIDESTWVENGSDESLARQVEKLDAIWFVGGDQTLITKVLLNKDGSDTPVLKAIRKLYDEGGAVGGTSAGAAIMSDIMIAGGNSTNALLAGFKQDYASMDEQEFGPVVVSKGLNLFKYGVIDQHFDRKARLGRLIVTLLENTNTNYAYGIDEGTAMIVNDGKFEVIGDGGVTVINTTESVKESGTYPLQVTNIRLSYIQKGDTYDLHTHQYTQRENSYETIGHEYLNVPAQSVSGIMSANRNLDEFIGFDLVDNKATKEVRSLVLGSEGKGIQLRFSQDEQTIGYWSQDISKDIYSFNNVKLDIVPVKVSIQ